MRSTWKGLTAGLWLLAVLCASVWAEFDSRLDKHWDLWKKTHQKKHQNEVEEMSRRALWEKNLQYINTHNLEASLGLHTYTLGVNHLSDRTEDELLQFGAPLKIPKDFKITPTPLHTTSVDLPDTVDWRKSGYVTRVKNQGSCQSCWAFSAVGALEGLLAKTTGKLVDLSPQNLVDCSWEYGNYGCGGGWIHRAFNYVIANNGIESEASYPYQGVNGSCHYSHSYRAATSFSYYFVNQDELSLKQAVATFGPIATTIDSSSMLFYKSGVYNSWLCGKKLNHAVLLVGYGTDQSTGLDYWLIKNSWGRGWGEDGYIRLARNKSQMCGISLHSLFPL